MTATIPASTGKPDDEPAHRTVTQHYRRQIRRTGREARFLIALAFFITFGIVRFITYSIRYHWLPFLHDHVTKSGLHIHHFVYGIIILLTVGYLALAFPEQQGKRLIAFSLLYGIAAALILDEFALWLNLQDVYWAKQGRESLDVAAMVATLFLLGGTGAPFWSALWRDLTHRRP
ncbi:MAG: hypothetical protein LC748_03970 [Thermomicrobia bacterium]|nr:hypothetical protein [Thermomicrobia bacterium]